MHKRGANGHIVYLHISAFMAIYRKCQTVNVYGCCLWAEPSEGNPRSDVIGLLAVGMPAEEVSCIVLHLTFTVCREDVSISGAGGMTTRKAW